MKQNTSHAVMQQRHEPTDSLDDFPTPPWATRALMTHIINDNMSMMSCHEPACGRGYMVQPLHEFFGYVGCSDIHDYGYGAVEDFLDTRLPLSLDWIITNPPFRLAPDFIAKALATASVGVAMLVRTSFLEGIKRYNTIFLPTPPTIVAQFVERVPMVKGRLDPKASTATSYAWLVWKRGEAARPMMWVPPCRKQLERASDYAA